MSVKRFIFIMVILAMAKAGQAVERIAYKNPTGKEFPILAWYSILGEGNLTPERYKELRSAGFNISFSHFSKADEVEKGLKACRKTGVKLMITCSGLENETEATVNRFKKDKMVAGWFLRDEPVVAGFPDLRKFRDRVYQADQTHITYLNLLPSIVSPQDLGTKTYEEYVQRFVDEVDLPQISYDCYPVIQEGENVVLRPQFYNNLEDVRRVSLRTDRPFWAFCLSTAHDPYPIPTDTHLRIEAFSALAYGAQCIQHFTYWEPGAEIWNFHNAPIDKNGKRTHVYYLVKNLNREIQNLAWVFLGAKAVSVGHTGENIPEGTERLAAFPAKVQKVEADGQGVLVSHLVNGKKHFLMVLNRDIDHSQNVAIQLEKGVKRVLPSGETKKLKDSGTQTVNLTAGNYVLYQLN